MEIAEFLLARIGEDEAVVEAAAVCECRVWYEPERPAEPPKLHDPDCPTRVLAECAAKRRVVEGCAETLAGEDDYDPLVDGGTREPYELARFVLGALAQPYVDHPGFDPAWKV